MTIAEQMARLFHGMTQEEGAKHGYPPFAWEDQKPAYHECMTAAMERLIEAYEKARGGE